MRFLFICVISLFPLLSFAGEMTASGQPSSEKAARLDVLFRDLKAAPNEQAALTIEQNIWIEWTSPEDPELAKLMEQALNARRVADYEKALTILGDVTRDWSGYAEGWNQRATVHFLMGNFEKSLQDVAETLKREPRHFGALAGRGMIRLQQARPALAVQNILKAMEFHPYLRERGLVAALMDRGVTH